MTTTPIGFTVAGKPAPKPVGPKPGRNSALARRNAWQRYFAHKTAIGLAANRYFPEQITGPVELGVCFYLPTPKTFSAADLRRAKAGELVPTGKPDLKNLVAAVEDALTGIAWGDDSQVVAYGFAYKRYAVYPLVPRSYIHIVALPRGLPYHEASAYSTRAVHALAAEREAEI